MDRFLTLNNFPSLVLWLHLKSKRLLFLALRETSGLYLETVVGWILQNFGTESGSESPAVAIVRSQMHAGIPVIPESTQVSFCGILYIYIKKKKKKLAEKGSLPFILQPCLARCGLGTALGRWPMTFHKYGQGAQIKSGLRCECFSTKERDRD